MNREMKEIRTSKAIEILPGVKGFRAFPAIGFKDSDPFLMLDQVGPEQVGKGYRIDGEGHDHPHRGFETMSIVFEGQMNHRDSKGNKAEINSGGVQRMNAGSGIIHGGRMRPDQFTERFHEVQLWVNIPQAEKMSEPEVQNVTADHIPNVKIGEVVLRVLSGKLQGKIGPLNMKATAHVGHILSQNGGEVVLDDFGNSDQLMVYVLEGNLAIDGTTVGASELAVFEKEGDTIGLKLEAGSQALILAGQRLNEPVAFGGPFVMNTPKEIDQAYADFEAGKFGSIAS
ncbi:MAG: pirin family protein [Reichenbachiella sp.]